MSTSEVAAKAHTYHYSKFYQFFIRAVVCKELLGIVKMYDALICETYIGRKFKIIEVIKKAKINDICLGMERCWQVALINDGFQICKFD